MLPLMGEEYFERTAFIVNIIFKKSAFQLHFKKEKKTECFLSQEKPFFYKALLQKLAFTNICMLLQNLWAQVT